MQKRVTFVEQLRKENLFRNGNGDILMRSADTKRYRDGLEFPHQERETYKETHITMSASNRHMKTIHIPRTLMSVPFLQHPALTRGPRCHLCSVVSVYSTEHMRQQMKQHYLNVLHSCIQPGQNLPCRGHVEREKRCFSKEAEKNKVEVKPKGQKRGSRCTAYSDFVLPKIKPLT